MPLAAFGNVFGPDLLIFGLLALVAGVFWLWMLIDCITSKRLGDTDKIIWVLVILLTQIIGAILYFFMARGRSRVDRPGP